MSLVGEFGDEQEIVAAEAVGVVPLLALAVAATEGRIVAGAVFGVVAPDGGLDAAEAEFESGAGTGWILSRGKGHRFGVEVGGVPHRFPGSGRSDPLPG